MKVFVATFLVICGSLNFVNGKAELDLTTEQQISAEDEEMEEIIKALKCKSRLENPSMTKLVMKILGHARPPCIEATDTTKPDSDTITHAEIKKITRATTKAKVRHCRPPSEDPFMTKLMMKILGRTRPPCIEDSETTKPYSDTTTQNQISSNKNTKKKDNKENHCEPPEEDSFITKWMRKLRGRTRPPCTENDGTTKPYSESTTESLPVSKTSKVDKEINPAQNCKSHKEDPLVTKWMNIILRRTRPPCIENDGTTTPYSETTKKNNFNPTESPKKNEGESNETHICEPVKPKTDFLSKYIKNNFVKNKPHCVLRNSTTNPNLNTTTPITDEEYKTTIAFSELPDRVTKKIPTSITTEPNIATLDQQQTTTEKNHQPSLKMEPNLLTTNQLQKATERSIVEVLKIPLEVQPSLQTHQVKVTYEKAEELKTHVVKRYSVPQHKVLTKIPEDETSNMYFPSGISEEAKKLFTYSESSVTSQESKSSTTMQPEVRPRQTTKLDDAPEKIQETEITTIGYNSEPQTEEADEELEEMEQFEVTISWNRKTKRLGTPVVMGLLKTLKKRDILDVLQYDDIKKLNELDMPILSKTKDLLVSGEQIETDPEKSTETNQKLDTSTTTEGFEIANNLEGSASVTSTESYTLERNFVDLAARTEPSTDELNEEVKSNEKDVKLLPPTVVEFDARMIDGGVSRQTPISYEAEEGKRFMINLKINDEGCPENKRKRKEVSDLDVPDYHTASDLDEFVQNCKL